ncbi:hypothetical protein TWF696_005600 [Orbilia brochopaga]|uniref:F-box domain-containing protein n=1 Tax=Orbilia brochopaga TaxID=3140254 RepID=A0AAV9V538_9PEZI
MMTEMPILDGVTVRPKPTVSSFAALPSDIIYEICDYLPNADILKLQLVSSTLLRKLPRSRIDAIHSRKTYFLCHDGIRKLERVARIPALAERVTHVTFDLESPYVGLLKRYWCIGTAMGYPQETRFKLQRWYHNHMSRSLSMSSRRSRTKEKTENKPSLLRKMLKKLKTLSRSAKSSKDRDRKSNMETAEPESPNYEDAFHEIFTLFEVHLTTLYSNWNGKAELLERITNAFRSLPNLRVLEFIRTDITKEEPSTMLSIWRQYNPDLQWLLSSNPEIEDGDLPWTDWFSREALHSYLWEAYPSILFSAVQAGRRISEIRVGTLSLEYPKAGAMLSFFEPYHARISDSTGRQASESEMSNWIAKHRQAYSNTFKGLKRLEICLDEKEREPYHTSYYTVSPLFLETVRNVEELAVWRMPNEVRRDQSAEFVMPTSTRLENLRRLEIGRAGITLDGLMEFMRTNAASLREVICAEDTFRGTMAQNIDIVSFLNCAKAELQLTTLEADFMLANQSRRMVDEKKYYLSIKVNGDWKDLSHCSFQVGMKYRYISVMEGKDTLQSHWTQQHSWEEFVQTIRKIDVDRYFNPR